MTTTRTQAETLLIKRVGPLLEAVDLDSETIQGDNKDLNGPIGWALRQLEISVSDPTSVSDTDMASLADADLDHFLDLAELRVMETVLNSALSLVDLAVGPRKESLSQMATSLQTITRSFNTVDIDRFIFKEWIEESHCVGATTNTCNECIWQAAFCF